VTYNVGNSVVGDIPTTASIGDPGVSIPDAEAGLTAYCATNPTPAYCGPGGFTPNALSLKLLPLYGSNNTNGSSVALGFPDVVSIYNIIGEIDYHRGDHHTFAGPYFFGNGTSTAEDTTITQANFRSLGQLRAEFVTTSWTWTPNSSWVNDVRFGWNFHHRIVSAADHLTPLSTYGINTGVTNPILGGLPTIEVSGFSQVSADANVPKKYGPTSNYDLVDQVSYLRGRHAFKFGGEILTFRANYGAFGSGRGRFRFKKNDLFSKSTPLEGFLAGVPDQGSLLVGDAARLLTKWEYSGFFEDVWRVKPHVP
jgi:hypothetical protein